VLPKESQFLLGVRTAIVEKRVLEDRVTVAGVVTVPPERHGAIFAPQSGRVTPPAGGFPQLGARIKKGQRLGVVEAVLSASDRASFISEEARGRADASAAAARLDAAEKSLARLQSLTGVTSQREIEAASVEVSSARAALAEAQARQGAFSTSAGTSRFELVSPLDGVLADVNISPGEVLNQGERAFLVIDPTALTVEAKVPEHELARLHDSTDALVTVDAYRGKAFPGKLIAEAQVIDADTRTAKVIFAVDNKDGLLKLGMFAQVQIGAGAEASVVSVPDAAVLDIDGRRVVYVHVSPEEFEAKEVSLGRRDGALWEVRAGLDGGERVVVVGAYNLRSAQAR
jgi:cobalt-zinc-cadmium efflux system membrane fusion protein